MKAGTVNDTWLTRQASIIWSTFKLTLHGSVAAASLGIA
jgi:hypothetical protein